MEIGDIVKLSGSGYTFDGIEGGVVTRVLSTIAQVRFPIESFSDADKFRGYENKDWTCLLDTLTVTRPKSRWKRFKLGVKNLWMKIVVWFANLNLDRFGEL